MNISELYQLSLQTTGVQQATATLLEIYKDPANFSAILETLMNDQNQITRRQAAIGLRTMLSMHWEDLVASGQADALKSQILTALVNEPIQKNRHAIIDAFDPILRDSKLEWPELRNFADSLLSSDDIDQQEVALTIYGVLAQNMDISELSTHLSTLTDLILNALRSGNEDLTIAAAHLTQKLTLVFEAPAPSEVQVCIASILQLFKFYLINESPITYKLANEIGECASQNSCIEANSFLTNLLELANDEEIPEGQIYIIFTPISATIYNKFDDIGEDLIPIIIQSLLTNVARCFIETESAEAQSDAYYICDTLSDLIKKSSDSTSLFENVISEVNESSYGNIFAGAYLIQIFIEMAPEVCGHHINFIMEFLTKQIDTENGCPAVMAVVFQALQVFIRVFNAGLSDYSSILLNGSLLAAQLDDETVEYSALNMLQELLTTIDVNVPNIPEFLDTLVSIAGARTGGVRERALFAVHAFIFAAGETIRDLAPNLYQVFLDAMQEAVTSEDYKLIGTSLRGLATLHKACPEEMSSFAQQTLQTLTESLQSNEIYVITAAQTAAVILSDIPMEGSLQFLTQAVESAFNLLQTPLPSNDNEDEAEIDNEFEMMSEEMREMIELKACCLDLIIAILKNHPEIIQPAAEQLIEHLIGLANNIIDEDLSSLSIECISIMTNKFNLDKNEILAQISDIFSSPYSSTVSKIFEMAASFIKSNSDFSNAQLEMLLEEANSAIDLELPSTEEARDETVEAIDSAVKFLCKIAKYKPELFQKDKFIVNARKLMKKKGGNEIILISYATILGKFFLIHAENLQSIERKTILQILTNSCSLCDGFINPRPLKMFAKVLDKYKENIFQPALAFIEDFIDFPTDCVGRPYHKETIAYIATISLLLANYSDFDISDYISAVVYALPVTIPHISNIYYAGLEQFYKQASKMLDEDTATRIFSGLFKLFTLSASEFNEVKLTIEAAKSAAFVASSLLNAMGGEINENTNQAMIERFQKRLSRYA